VAAEGPPLQLRDVSVRFGERTALAHVDLTVPRGEFLALAGPNGSGKTTLLRAVLGLLASHEGVIELFGAPADRLKVADRARHIAWVPQEESPRDNVRLFDYVLYGRFAYHGPLDAETGEDRAIALRALAEVGLADRATDGILSLSGGERQRAVLARALAQTTPVLLLDEPTAHLDIAHQLDLFGRVRRLVRERAVTVVAAVHDLNLAARYADRIVVLSRGRLVADGPPATVLTEELLARVWGISADLRRDPRTGIPYLIPQNLLTSPGAEPPTGGPIHVVGGGGSASPILRRLTEEGFRATVGIVPLLDSDAETAQVLSLPAAIEAPFAPIGAAARARNDELLRAARAIVVAPFPVGPSNLENLESLLPRVGAVPIFLVTPPTIIERDFTGGRAQTTYAALRAGGAREVTGIDPLLLELRALRADRSAASTTGRGAATANG
jgi:iron complex transport system ATP-binding protein